MKKLFSILILLNIFCYKYIQYPVNEIKTDEEIIKIESNIENNYLFELEIPKIKLKNKIYSLNDKNNNVDKNIELLEPFNPPDNENSIVILAGHNGNTNVSFFKKLYKLKLSDQVIIEYKNKKYVYEIVNIYDIEKTGKAIIKKENYKDILVLITCKGNDKQTIFISSLVR